MPLHYLEQLVEQTWNNGRPIEGSADTTELAYIAKLARDPRVRLIGEVGFNAGFSSYTFLEANPNAQVYSFDLDEYDYIAPAKEHIDTAFPGRHTLILGNSLETVPEFKQKNPTLQFDLIFVDGGHDYEVAKADLTNMRAFASEHTVLITDDLTPWKPWGVGPTRAWQEALATGLVDQHELVKDGTIVETIAPPGERSWAKGAYIL